MQQIFQKQHLFDKSRQKKLNSNTRNLFNNCPVHFLGKSLFKHHKVVELPLQKRKHTVAYLGNRVDGRWRRPLRTQNCCNKQKISQIFCKGTVCESVWNLCYQYQTRNLSKNYEIYLQRITKTVEEIVQKKQTKQEFSKKTLVKIKLS